MSNIFFAHLSNFVTKTKGGNMSITSKLTRFSVILSMAATLTACGGGGDGGTAISIPSGPIATVGAAQGYYTGSFSSTNFPNGKFDNLVLDDDSYYALYGNRDTNTGAFVVYGLIQGNGIALNDGTFSSSNLKDYFFDGQVFNGSLTATYQPGATFRGTVLESGQSIALSGLAPTAGSTNYIYNTPAVLSTITGSWSGTNLGGAAQAFTVFASGALSGTDANGCGYSGSILPRSSGKNVFNVNLTINRSTACGISSGIIASGIATASLLSNGGQQLIISVTSSDRNLGSVLFATR